MAKSALVIIDLINDYLDQFDDATVARLVSGANRLAGAFRKRALPVIWVRQEFKPDLSDAFLEMRDRAVKIAIEGTRGAELHAGLDWSPDDATIVKKRYSAFFRTDLDALLERHGVDQLVLCGVNTHACIRMAAIDAYQRDLRVVLAGDCISSYDEEHARVSLAYMNGKIAKAATVEEIITALGPRAKAPVG
ncbi:cysteine hydrolase [Hoeflea sp. WL0058]|uniref:Cysteine hydrolase n=1 Tax=Flavimaribacter sediminis TaxID=2865987 RepID=A0AAE3D169_9HYPH|nr:isochorismatase family cysteine hydrolase [Flavimaribacter sediminis]MBW8639350.1 cysteine hydrolase [Flavimaribacter sediminis]